MKKSNKLILGGFLMVIFFITAIHIALYAKYKNGDYTIYNPEDYLVRPSMESFPGVKFVSVRNVSGATVKFGDTAQVEKGVENRILYLLSGDTLKIIGKEYDNQRVVIRDDVAVIIPYNATVSVLNSTLSFKTGKNNAEVNPAIYLQRSTAIFSGTKNPFLFGNMKIVASDSSIATFHGNTQVNNLEVQLSKSAIEYSEGNVGQLSIVTDSVSRISLQTKHLLKAKISIAND